MVKLQRNKVTRTYSITIPKALIKHLNWVEGEELFFFMDEQDRIFIRA